MTIRVIAYETLTTEDDSIKVRNTNPSFFRLEGVRKGFDAVFAPSFPKIEAAYEKAGKTIYRPSQEDVNPTPITDDQPVSPPSVSEDVQDSQEEVSNEMTESFVTKGESFFAKNDEEVVEGHWSELKWPKLRSLATEFTDEPVMSKEQAKEILTQAEAEGKL